MFVIFIFFLFFFENVVNLILFLINRWLYLMNECWFCFIFVVVKKSYYVCRERIDGL